MRKIGVVYGGSSHHHRTYIQSEFSRFFTKYFYLPDFHREQIGDIDVLIVPSQLHMKLLLKNKEKIVSFANDGGIVVAFGPQSIQWIPKQSWEFRPTNYWWWLEKDAKSGLVATNPDADIFRYLTLTDATWHQHGVFWPPEEADTIIGTEDGGSVFYIDKVSTNGVFIVTTLDPDYHYGTYFMPATERFLKGFLPWLANGEI